MLASLQSTLPAGLAHEIIFVDDGSTDGTRAWLAGLGAPCRVMLNDRNLGFAGACNHGAAAARGEYLFFLNNDLVLLPGWLEPMLAVFAAHSDAGLVGNVQRNATTGAIDHAGLAFDVKGKPVHLTRRGWGTVRAAIGVTGACCAIRAGTWRALGGFDEEYRNGCEDVDLGLRAAAAGLTNYVALGSVVLHHISASAGRKLRDEQNTARLQRRWREFILDRIVRQACRICLAAAWDEPRNYVDPALARACLWYQVGLPPWPTPGVRVAGAAALDLERARWAELLDHAPPRAPREVAPVFFPVTPERPPVY